MATEFKDDNRGWTCEHQLIRTNGPCPKCVTPYTGICGHCKRPLDDHFFDLKQNIIRCRKEAA